MAKTRGSLPLIHRSSKNQRLRIPLQTSLLRQELTQARTPTAVDFSENTAFPRNGGPSWFCLFHTFTCEGSLSSMLLFIFAVFCSRSEAPCASRLLRASLPPHLVDIGIIWDVAMNGVWAALLSLISPGYCSYLQLEIPSAPMPRSISWLRFSSSHCTGRRRSARWKSSRLSSQS